MPVAAEKQAVGRHGLHELACRNNYMPANIGSGWLSGTQHWLGCSNVQNMVSGTVAMVAPYSL
jgi:hypothetical protein